MKFLSRVNLLMEFFAFTVMFDCGTKVKYKMYEWVDSVLAKVCTLLLSVKCDISYCATHLVKCRGILF